MKILQILLSLIVTLPLIGSSDKKLSEESHADTILHGVRSLSISTEKQFQTRFFLTVDSLRIEGYVSWQAPDRRGLIVLSKHDQFPLMIAVDGNVFYYDVVTGNILWIRAEPVLIIRTHGGIMQIRCGINADFQTHASMNVFDLDFASIIQGFKKDSSHVSQFHSSTSTFTAETNSLEAGLQLKSALERRPTLFYMRSNAENVLFDILFDSITFSSELPKWHKPLDVEMLQKHVPVLEVREAGSLSAPEQRKLEDVRKFIQGGAMFIPRESLYDPALQNALKENSPIKLDFEEMAENDRKLRDSWLKALREQNMIPSNEE